MNAGQASIGSWIPGAWKLTPNKKSAHDRQIRRKYTRQLPGDRYMYDEVVNFAFTYTPENAVEYFDLDFKDNDADG